VFSRVRLLADGLILRPLFSDPVRAAMTIAGVAIGISVVVSVHLATRAATASMKDSIAIVAGRTALEVSGGGYPFDEAVLRDMEWLRDEGVVSPVVTGRVRVVRRAGAGPAPPSAETLTILGVDLLKDIRVREYGALVSARERKKFDAVSLLRLLTEPNAVIVTEGFASRHGLAVGDRLPVLVNDRAHALAIQGVLADEGIARAMGGDFALMDIAGAQDLFDRFLLIDRIDIAIHEGVSLDTVRTRLETTLPPSLNVTTPARRGTQADALLAAFRVNMSILSAVALVVGVFLIHNTISVSVVRRRSEIGTLRVLGVDRGRILALFLAEGAFLGLAGAALGVAGGWLLARAVVGSVTRTVSSFYLSSLASTAAAELRLDLPTVAGGLAFGLIVALISSAIPAREAAGISPVEFLRAGSLETKKKRRRSLSVIAGLLLLALAYPTALAGPVDGLPLFGYLSAFLVIAGCSFLAPAGTALTAWALRRPLARLRAPGVLAGVGVRANITATAAAVTALMIGVAMFVSVAVMVLSFRETFLLWLSQTMTADLVVSPEAQGGRGFDHTIDEAFVGDLHQVPGIAAIDLFRGYTVDFRGVPVTVGGAALSVMGRHARLSLLSGADPQPVLESTVGSGRVIVSEPFSRRFRVGRGESILVPSPAGPVAVTVADVYRDYASDRGSIIFDRSTFLVHFPDRRVNAAGLFLSPGADVERARGEILERAAEAGKRVAVATNAEIRRQAVRVFDQTFAITYALEAIAVIVAVLGIVNTQIAQVLDRRREIGLLRFLGASRRQVGGMMLVEAVLLATTGIALGVVLGVILSLILVFVINLQSFGWTIEWSVPGLFVVQAVAAILLATVLAGMVPAWRAAGVKAGAEVREE
jgi:putative ABC transport system permease protein